MRTPTLGQHLLPNLRSIHWAFCSWNLLPFLRVFLNPGLVGVEIEFPNEEPHLYRPAAVSLIPTRNLTHLRLESMGTEDATLDAVQDLLDGACETLTSVSLDGELSMAVVEKILQLPNLRFLGIKVPRARISPPAVVFPSLETLIIGYKEAESWLHILQNMPNPTLMELDSAFFGSSPTHLQTLGCSLLDANIQQSLIILQCSFETQVFITEAGIRPFLSFRRLTALNILSFCTEEQCGVQLNDSVVCELAVALPKLEILTLGGCPCKATPDATVASLVALSTNCVDLEFLRLHFNARDIVSCDIYANSRTHRFTCKLRSLSVGSLALPSDRDEIPLVIFAILRIFPHLETIVSTRGCWDQVEQGVRLLRQAQNIIPPLTAS